MLYTDASCNYEIPTDPFNRNLKISVEPSVVTCQIGSSINIVATVNSSNTSYQWYNEEGNPIATQSVNNLFFKSVQMKDFGFYRLEIVDLKTGQRVMSRWAEVKRSVIGTETIKPSKPILLSSSPGGSYRIGSTLTLNASFRNATAYQWYKDGERLEGCKGNTLMITNANMSNNGIYVLSATNCPFSGIMEMAEGMKISVY